MTRLAKGPRNWISKGSALLAVRMSPEQWALCLAVGIVLGIFPAPACPTVLCAAAALALRLNSPAMQAVNYSPDWETGCSATRWGQ